MRKQYVVTLTESEREELEALIRKGRVLATAQRHARILLQADEGPFGPALTDEVTAQAVQCGLATVHRVRKRFIEEGLPTALRPKPKNRRYERKLDGASEARLITLACSEPPEGRSRWTLKLFAEELVALEIVDSVSPQTVLRTLKKTNFNLI